MYSFKGTNMIPKILFLLLGYDISYSSSTKEDHPHLNHTNLRMKESCDSRWSELVCKDQTHYFSACERLSTHYSYRNLLKNHIIFQPKSRQKYLTCTDKVFKDIHMMEEVFGINHTESNIIENFSSPLLLNTVFSNSETETFRDRFWSKTQYENISTVVANTKVSAIKSLSYYISCVKIIEEVSLLFIRSGTLLDYVGSRHFPTKITLRRSAARIKDQKIFHIISNVTNTFNIIEQRFSSCILSHGTETMLLTKSSFLWFKVDEPYRFQNLSGILQKRGSFFKISPQLLEELAQKRGLISVQFMTSENPLRLSYKNFVSLNQVLLLSIKREGEHFENLSVPIDLFFKYKIEARGEQLFQGVAHRPTNYETHFDKDQLVSVYKLLPFHFPGSGIIQILFYNLNMNSLRVAMSSNKQPDWETMILNSTVVTSKSPVYEVPLEDQTKDSVNYLGIISANIVSGTIEYRFEARYFQCYSKFGIEWKSDGCKVGAQTNETILHCQCRHLSLFGGGVAIAPRKIDFKQDIQLLHLVGENLHPCILVASVILIYFMILVWTRHNDKKDELQRFVVVLDDNFPGEEWPYLLTVYTSFWIGSGTEAKVGVRLYGTKGISRIHILNKFGIRKVLKSNCDDWFMIFTPKNLGEIEKIHIFSDFTGFNPDWYCRKIMLYDLEGQKEFKFVIEKWVSLAEEDECLDFFCYPTPTKKSLRRDRIAMNNIVFGLQETHLLFSIFTRHPRSSVTRSQRLSICICILVVHLLTSNIFHESDLPQFPQYSETKSKLIIQMESTLVAAPFTFIVIFCFKKSRIITVPKNDVPMTLTSTLAVPLETGLEISQNKQAIPQYSENIAGKENQLKEFTRSSESLEEESNEDEEETDEEELEEEEVEEEEEEKELEEGCFKNCYNQIRALVFQIIVTKTVMPVKIAEEDETSSRIRKRWMFFAWLLCEFAIFGSAFFVILYSLKMKPEVCSEWMLSCMKYSLTNIFFMAPLKITVFALILAGLYGQLHYIPSYECNTEAAVKRKLIGNKKFLSRLLTIRKSKCYKPINSKKIQKIRYKKKNWRRWRMTINFSVTVVLFVLLMLEVEMSWRGLYVTTEHHYQKMFDPISNGKPITDFKSFVDYLTNVVIPSYDKEIWYNGAKLMAQNIWKQETSFLKDYSTRLVGIPRLRQQRVKPEACVIPTDIVDKLDLQQCYASITWSNIDKRDYALSWTKPEKLVEDSNNPWVFSDLKNTPLIMCGKHTSKCYMPGGYIAKLSIKEAESKSIVKRLLKDEWFDGLTRVVFFETVVYNVNSDMITSLRPMMEKLADGSIFIHISTTSLHPVSDDFVSTLMILLTFAFYYFIRIVLLFNRKGLKYLLSGTGILDTSLSLLLYSTMVSLYLNRDARKEYLRSWQLQEETDLQIIRDIFVHRTLIKYETGATLVLLPIQLLHSFWFGKQYFIYFKSLSYCSKYAVGIALVTAMFYMFTVLYSAINNTLPGQCLYNRWYNNITYCTFNYKLAYQLEILTFISWFMSNIAAFVACVTTIYGYKWMKEQNKYADDFDLVTFLLGRINPARKQITTVLLRALRRVVSFAPQRVRAGADTTDVLEEDINPRNRPLSYTKIMLNEMNMKFDTILEKLKTFEKTV